MKYLINDMLVVSICIFTLKPWFLCGLQMKRRSHSGSALLSSTSSQRLVQPQQQMSLSSTGLNLMSGELSASSALLAQLLQPATMPAAVSGGGAYHHVKPILPAPAPLVAPPLAALAPAKPSGPSSADLTPSRTQPPVIILRLFLFFTQTKWFVNPRCIFIAII